MDIGATNTAGFDFDIDVSFLELFGFELSFSCLMTLAKRLERDGTHFLLLESGPILLGFYHEALKSVWITHSEMDNIPKEMVMQ